MGAAREGIVGAPAGRTCGATAGGSGEAGTRGTLDVVAGETRRVAAAGPVEQDGKEMWEQQQGDPWQQEELWEEPWEQHQKEELGEQQEEERGSSNNRDPVCRSRGNWGRRSRRK